MLESIEAFELRIPFKVAFKHASAERKSTQTVWVRARDASGSVGYGEGCPREYVTAESVASACDFISAHREEWRRSLNGVDALRRWVADRSRDIDANPAAWTAVELAVLDVLGKSAGRSIESLLGLPELAGTYRYTAVMGDASTEAFQTQLVYYLRAGFQSYKIKLSGDVAHDRAKIEALKSAGIPCGHVRADANNLWSEADAAIETLRKLDFSFFALEEPLKAGDMKGMRAIARQLGTRIIVDESVLRAEQLAELGDDAPLWLVNVRISKMGGLLRSLELLREANRLGLGIVVGAHVGETSLLTRAALVIAAAARDRLVAQEGAFGTHLLEHDAAERPLMFGPGGTLDTAALGISASPGFGLKISSALAVVPAPETRR